MHSYIVTILIILLTDDFTMTYYALYKQRVNQITITMATGLPQCMSQHCITRPSGSNPT